MSLQFEVLGGVAGRLQGASLGVLQGASRGAIAVEDPDMRGTKHRQEGLKRRGHFVRGELLGASRGVLQGASRWELLGASRGEIWFKVLGLKSPMGNL